MQRIVFSREQLRIYAVTDRLMLQGRMTVAQAVELAILGGATMVQLREKHLTGEQLREEAIRVQAVCRKYRVPFLVNDDPLLAREIGADGVHVGQSDVSAREAREILGENAILGVTAKTVEQAVAAQQDGADYLGSGAVFGTSTKDNASFLPLERLQEIVGTVSIPVVAIGGIDAGNIQQLSGIGIAGVAVVGGIFAQPDIQAAAGLLRVKFQSLCPDPGTDRGPGWNGI